MSLFNVLVTPFIKTSETSKAFTILVISFKSSLENFTVFEPEPYIFFLIAAYVADIAARRPKGVNTFFHNEIAGLVSFGKNLIKIDPKAPPDFIILFICALLNFISADMLFSTFSYYFVYLCFA